MKQIYIKKKIKPKKQYKKLIKKLEIKTLKNIIFDRGQGIIKINKDKNINQSKKKKFFN